MISNDSRVMIVPRAVPEDGDRWGGLPGPRLLSRRGRRGRLAVAVAAWILLAPSAVLAAAPLPPLIEGLIRTLTWTPPPVTRSSGWGARTAAIPSPPLHFALSAIGESQQGWVLVDQQPNSGLEIALFHEDKRRRIEVSRVPLDLPGSCREAGADLIAPETTDRLASGVRVQVGEWDFDRDGTPELLLAAGDGEAALCVMVLRRDVLEPPAVIPEWSTVAVIAGVGRGRVDRAGIRVSQEDGEEIRHAWAGGRLRRTDEQAEALWHRPRGPAVSQSEQREVAAGLATAARDFGRELERFEIRRVTLGLVRERIEPLLDADFPAPDCVRADESERLVVTCRRGSTPAPAEDLADDLDDAGAVPAPDAQDAQTAPDDPAPEPDLAIAPGAPASGADTSANLHRPEVARTRQLSVQLTPDQRAWAVSYRESGLHVAWDEAGCGRVVENQIETLVERFGPPQLWTSRSVGWGFAYDARTDLAFDPEYLMGAIERERTRAHGRAAVAETRAMERLVNDGYLAVFHCHGGTQYGGFLTFELHLMSLALLDGLKPDPVFDQPDLFGPQTVPEAVVPEDEDGVVPPEAPAPAPTPAELGRL